jgi:ubiquinone/menaquinone biosynthesis C-methylase UbiE
MIYPGRPICDSVVGKGVTSVEQLQRQLDWLRESWTWLLRTRVLDDRRPAVRPNALDVGCGPGLVMDLISSDFNVVGLDVDRETVMRGRERGLNVLQGDASSLPFEDGSFDLVYCSFTLMWVSEPQAMLEEMARVSRKHVICLAEPDYGGRICVPEEVASLDRYLVGSLIDEGADPFVGRKMGGMMSAAGLKVEMGVHSGLWSPEQLMKQAEAEWASIAADVGDLASRDELDRAKASWDRALADRTLFLFNPVFFAIGRK